MKKKVGRRVGQHAAPGERVILCRSKRSSEESGLGDAGRSMIPMAVTRTFMANSNLLPGGGQGLGEWVALPRPK